MSAKAHIKKAIQAVKKNDVRHLRTHITNAIVEKVRLSLEKKEKQLAKQILNEEVILNEDVLSSLKQILGDNSANSVKFKDGSSLKVDLQTANVVVTVHGALKKPDAKQKFEDMMNSSKSQFMKIVDFSWKMVK